MNLRTSRARWIAAAAVLCVLVASAGSVVAWLNLRDEAPVSSSLDGLDTSPRAIARGAYLARAGNCMGCHTALGGAPMAGGRAIATSFGTFYTPNITPDPKTGIGDWSPSEFWRAMHHGRSKSGRLLYPAFPYTNFTVMTRADTDALFAFLQSESAVVQDNLPHDLKFPYDSQIAIALWRAVYFSPAQLVDDPTHDADWNRGRYLVQGVAHCAACHSTRNALGGIDTHAEFAGGRMPDSMWLAPSLASPDEAGVQRFEPEQTIRLLKDGVVGGTGVAGPMAEVVFTSTQYLSEDDLRGIARYLASIPEHASDVQPDRAASANLGLGQRVYEQSCAACHGQRGEGAASAYPPLAGNRTVLLHDPANVLLMIREGGFFPATAGNPRPYGMPPYAQTLDDEQIAAVASYIRQSWGNDAPIVSTIEVRRVR